MKKIRILLTTLCVCIGLLSGMHVSAEVLYVYDMADLLSADEEQNLQNLAIEFHEKWSMNFLVIATEDTYGASSGEFADVCYDICFPDSSEDDGCVFLIDMDHREIYLSTCGKAMEYLTNDRIESILDEAYNYVADGDYYGTFQSFFESTGQYLEQGIPEESQETTEVYVYDIADLLTTEEELEFQKMALEFQEKWDMNFLAVTTDDALGYTSKEFADGFYDVCFPESFEEDGCLFLIDMDNREIYLSTCGKATEYLTDSRVDSILDEAYNYVADGDYYGTLAAFFESAESYLEQGVSEIIQQTPNEEVENVLKEYDQTEDLSGNTQKNIYLEQENSAAIGMVAALIAAAAAAMMVRRSILGKYQLKYVEVDYEREAYGNADLDIYNRSEKLLNSFVTSRTIQQHVSSYNYNDDYPRHREREYSEPVRRSSSSRSSGSSSRSHSGSGRSFGSSSSSRSHGGGGRSFSSRSSSRPSGSSRSTSRSSGGRSRGGGGRKF